MACGGSTCSLPNINTGSLVAPLLTEPQHVASVPDSFITCMSEQDTSLREDTEDAESRDDESLVGSPSSVSSGQVEQMEGKIRDLKSRLEGEDQLVRELLKSVNELRNVANTPASHTPSTVELPIISDKDMMNYAHKLHVCNVPDDRLDILEGIAERHNVTCVQLGLILGQLRYLAEKEQAVELFCRNLADPENLDKLVSMLEEDPNQDKDIISSLIESLINQFDCS